MRPAKFHAAIALLLLAVQGRSSVRSMSFGKYEPSRVHAACSSLVNHLGLVGCHQPHRVRIAASRQLQIKVSVERIGNARRAAR